MFEQLNLLGTELDKLSSIADKSKDSVLQLQIRNFVQSVQKEVQLGLEAVYAILNEIANLEDRKWSPDRVRKLQKELSNTFANKRFKILLDTCTRLQVLSENFSSSIQPFITMNFQADDATQIFWLLNKHEGALIFVIETGLRDLINALDECETLADYKKVRVIARKTHESLRLSEQKVMHAGFSFRGALAGGTNDLMRNQAADNVLRNSPLMTLSCYLGLFIVLLTALTIVLGTTTPQAFILIVLATYAGLIIIGAFQLRYDKVLKDEAFLKLMNLAVSRVLLPFSRFFDRKIPS